MTLKPGQETTLTMNYSMHEGMEGQHQFDVHVKTNDPANPETVLIVRSNWVP